MVSRDLAISWWDLRVSEQVSQHENGKTNRNMLFPLCRYKRASERNPFLYVDVEKKMKKTSHFLISSCFFEVNEDHRSFAKRRDSGSVHERVRG